MIVQTKKLNNSSHQKCPNYKMTTLVKLINQNYAIIFNNFENKTPSGNSASDNSVQTTK